MKPGNHFKLSKQTKRMCASITNAELRNAFRNIMIQAELAAQIRVKTKGGKEVSE